MYLKTTTKEDLRDMAWREKLWSIYTSNPNNYKIRRLESKRMQQIDRKLRQYYAVDKLEPVPVNNKENHYRTFDPSQLDPRSSFKEPGRHHHATLLLKDINRFDYPHSASAPPTPASSTPADTTVSQNKPSTTTTAANESATKQQSNTQRRLSNRFTVEKIKDNIV